MLTKKINEMTPKKIITIDTDFFQNKNTTIIFCKRTKEVYDSSYHVLWNLVTTYVTLFLVIILLVLMLQC